MPSPWIWAPPGVAALLFLLVLATGSNRSIFLWLNHGGQVLGPAVWLHLTMLGDGGVALALVLPTIRRAPRAFWAALVAAVIAGLWTQVTKQVIDLPRPLGVFAPEFFYQAGPAYRHVSFPSGHAAAAFALAGIWVMGVGRHWLLRAALLLVATLVGLSRIMLGVHWPLDVLWGMLGGWIGAWLGLAMYGRRGWRTSGPGGFLVGALLLAVAAWLLVSRHIGIPAIMPMQRAIGSVCLAWGAWEMLRMLAPMGWWRAQKRRWDG
ncbi:phosphatase PAP2 family protein [Massilia sp. 9096]|uniref:phosphatase PAP2 family protein n=1 Tax=Massilia sp. 9096 TaxID=1500894 RepID=UPI001EFBBBCE|nr:phosphatase PAP2 family protein [Massilia sp. 9096]